MVLDSSCQVHDSCPRICGSNAFPRTTAVTSFPVTLPSGLSKVSSAWSHHRTHLINRKRARCQRFGAAARREEGDCFARWRITHFGNPICRAWEAHILYGSSTDEQRSSSGKDWQPCGLFSGGHLAALLLRHRALRLCSFVAPCQLPARKQRAHFLFMRWVLSGWHVN